MSANPAFLNGCHVKMQWGESSHRDMNANINSTGRIGMPSAALLSPERAAKLEFEQVRLAERNLRPMLYSLPILGALTCVLLAAWINPAHLIAWHLLLCASCARYWISEKFLEFPHMSPDQIARWHPVLAWGLAGANIVWIIPQYAFFDQCSESGQMLLFLIGCCSLSCMLVMVASSTRMLWATIIPLGSAVVIPPILQGEPVMLALAGLGLGLTLYLGHVAWNINRGARELFLTREDKNELIEQLASAKFESDKARQRAEAASLAKSEFLANMSHELRTPLNAILGFSDIMQREIFGPLGAHQYAEYTGHINESGRHLLGLINEILDLARIESGRVALRLVEVNIRDAVRSATRAFELPAAEKNITLETDFDRNLPCLHADERGTQQILLNLISNAVKFTPCGGTVTVFARSLPTGELELGVRDTGGGIDPEDIDAVFAGFGRGRHDITSSKKGAGLGLPIVKGLVEAHGGKVTLQSELGKGTSIACRFPRERVTAPQPAQVRATVTP
jgi:two-component system cell cycle sensor histidine kinase PleC